MKYNNGVRRGNVSIHYARNKRKGNKQMWFPKNWTEKDIKKTGKYVMCLKRNQERKNNKAHTGTYKGVMVGTYTNNGRVTTIYPCYTQKGDDKQ